MLLGNTVRPQKWSNVIDLYDDDTYSAIWGEYDGSSQRCLGVRWNGGIVLSLGARENHKMLNCLL